MSIGLLSVWEDFKISRFQDFKRTPSSPSLVGRFAVLEVVARVESVRGECTASGEIGDDHSM